MSLKIYAIAVVGKHNQPLFVRGYTATSNALTKWHYVAHCSLDIFEERETLAGKTVDNYFGLLYTMDDYAVYGYQTNTRTRFVLSIAVTDAVVRDLDIKAIFRAIHTAYVHALSNAFVPLPSENPGGLSAPIRSKKFEAELDLIVRAHNQPSVAS